jgi:hypothetical protein
LKLRPEITTAINVSNAKDFLLEFFCVCTVSVLECPMRNNYMGKNL